MLEAKNYVPTLAIRASEMNGLEYLPGLTKDRMTPCILLAPWVNSLSLERAVERATKAFYGRSFFLDIDRDYEFTNLESAPQQQLVALLDSSNGFSNWCEFALTFEHVMPCVQTRVQIVDEIRVQIERYRKADRQFCIRLNMNRFPQISSEIVEMLAQEGASDFAVILEGGWTRDPLTLFSWFDGIIGGLLEPLDANVPIVLSCTSIPKMFMDFDGGLNNVPFSNHSLLKRIADRRGNRWNKIIYGDWGSTRPRSPAVFAQRPFDRIDYPTLESWWIVRNRKDNWDFRRAAQAITQSIAWDGDLGIWGEQMIESTIINSEIGIDTPQKNVASRVNIHLHRQAFFGAGDIGGMDLDEDWQD